MSVEASSSVSRFAERIGAPLSVTFKSKGLFNDHPHNLGIFGTLSSKVCLDTIIDSDCIVVFGAGLNERTTDKGDLFEGKSVIQVDSDFRRIGRTTEVTAGVVGNAHLVADSMIDLLDEAEVVPSNFAASRVAPRLPDTTLTEYDDSSTNKTVDIRTAMQWIDKITPSDRTVVIDTGRYFSLTPHYLTVPSPGLFIDTLNYAAIGLGMGTAIGAAKAHPEHAVLLVCGDGGFMLGGLAEFTTAVREGVDLIVAVLNDHAYGAEYIQFKDAGIDPKMTVFDWPEFAPLADDLGGHGIPVRSIGDFEAAHKEIERRDGRTPILIDIRVDPDSVGA